MFDLCHGEEKLRVSENLYTFVLVKYKKTGLDKIHYIMKDKYKIPYINACIRAFAKRFMLSTKTAFEYLYRFKGIDFLVEFYEIEHLQSIDDAVDDLIVCCSNNGGTLK